MVAPMPLSARAARACTDPSTSPLRVREGARSLGLIRSPRVSDPAQDPELHEPAPHEPAQTRPRARQADVSSGEARTPTLVVVVVAWLVLTLVALLQVLRGGMLAPLELEALVPAEHRSVTGEPWVLVRVDEARLTEVDPQTGEAPSDVTPGESAELDPRSILLDAGFAIEEALGPERVPLAPPRTEITRWLDAHALFLLPLEAHPALAERLSDASMLAEIRGLEARMTSPLFGVSPEQPRRDPLHVAELTRRDAGQLGHVDTPLDGGAQVTPSGDLVSANGQLLLIQLRSDRSTKALHGSIAQALDGRPVEFELLGPERRAAAAGDLLAGSWMTTIITCLAGLVLLLALVLRRLIPVLAIVVCLASAWLLLAWATGGFEIAGFALVVLLLGFGCDAALRLQRIGIRGWASTLVMASALLPLLVAPYPAWQRWAVIWALAYLGLALIMRVVLPAMLRLLGEDLEWQRPGFRLSAMPILAVLICVGLTASGAFAGTQLRHRAGHLLPLELGPLAERERELVEHFFDPALIVEARSPAPANSPLPSPAAAALDAAASDVLVLAELVPSAARRVDSPGSFVLPQQELDRRRASLAKLELDERMTALHDMLADQGLRAEAFAEFVRGAADLDDLPSAQAAIDGPLGPWIDRYLAGEGKDVALRSRIELRAVDHVPSSTIDQLEREGMPQLRGPAIAGLQDRHEFDDRLGMVVLAGLWLTAFWVWIGTRRLAVALAVGLVALASECGVLVGMYLLGQPIGPHAIPVLLLSGAAAGVAGGRSCRAVMLERPLVARGLLLAGLCQVVAGIALLLSNQPLWRELGLVVAIGSTLACGLGLFAAPGLASLLDRLDRRRPTDPPSKREPSA